MGQFSWLDCKSGEPILMGYRNVYLLLPKELRKKYGCSFIVGSEYRCDGIVGPMDVYELVAEMNRKYLSKDMLNTLPAKEEYCGLWGYEKEALRKKGFSEEEIIKADIEAQEKHYQNACDNWENALNMLMDYRAKKPKRYMVKTYGEEYLRDIGIAIASYDEQIEKLPYPMKLTYDSAAVYEDCGASLTDPGQGR